MSKISEVENLVEAIFDPSITKISINERVYMEVEPCPDCEGTGNYPYATDDVDATCARCNGKGWVLK